MAVLPSVEMGVECYLVKPDADGRVRYPFRDEHGRLPDAPEHVCVSSLKGVVPMLRDFAIGPRPDPLPPEELLRGISKGLAITLTEVREMNPEYAALIDSCPDEIKDRLELIYDLANAEVSVGGDEKARRRMQQRLGGEYWNLWELLRRMHRAAQDGWFACWSY